MQTKQRILFTLAALSFLLAANAQDTSRQQGIFSNVYIQNGFIAGRSMPGDLNDFRTLAPQSNILKDNFNDYKRYNGYDVNAGFAFTMMLGRDLRNRRTGLRNPNRQFRMGITYISQNGFSSHMHQETRHVFDTVSTPQGNLYYDSVQNKSVNMNYTSEQIRLDFSLIFRTDAKSRWSLYGGVGVSGGVSLNSGVSITQSSSNYIQSRGIFTGYNYMNAGLYDYEVETFSTKANYSIMAYVPLGIDFRMGRQKRVFWRRLHLYMEMRPGIGMTSIPGLQKFTSGQIHNAFGLRVKL